MNSLLSIGRFHFAALWRGHRFAVMSLFVSIAVFVTVLVLWIDSNRKMDETELALKRAVASLSRQSPLDTELPSVPRATLPSFEAATYTSKFHEVATGVGMHFDEVGYVMERSANVPYLRYRLTMSVKTRYPEVRRFIAALATELPNTTLDAIRCAKDSALPGTLGCELAFSAFFLKS